MTLDDPLAQLGALIGQAEAAARREEGRYVEMEPGKTPASEAQEQWKRYMNAERVVRLLKKAHDLMTQRPKGPANG